MSSLSDIPVELPTYHVSSFDFDDVFSAAETIENAYQFSVDKVREDLAKNMPAIEASWSDQIILPL